MKSYQLESAASEEINSLDKFCIVIPVRQGIIGALSSILSQAVVKAIDEKRCFLAFDISNEGGTILLRDELSESLSAFGIKNLEGCWLLCQNRLIPSIEAGKISTAYYDSFILAGIHAANKLKTDETRLALASSYLNNDKPYSVLCLNATPKMHRIRAVLELIDQGLISLEGMDQRGERVIPYVSFGKLDYVKGSITPNQVRNALQHKGQAHLEATLEQFLQALPLKADSFIEEGNSLATKIDVRHYTQTKISIITETSMGSECMRITEKTAKPLSLGHPFVIVGPMQSVRMARSMGFSVFDDFIDHSYDTINDPSDRLKRSIQSASCFVRQMQENKINLKELVSHVRHNIYFAAAGFYDFYWDQHVQPILISLGISEDLQVP